MSSEKALKNMLASQLRTYFTQDDKILDAFNEIRREDFVPSKYKKIAYADTTIPLGEERGALLPAKEIARLIGSLQIKPKDKILEIGTGCGYQTAMLAKLAQTVHTTDNSADNIETAKTNLAKYNFKNITHHQTLPHEGCAAEQPYDIIITSGCFEELPKALLEQLADHGRMGIFLGKVPTMSATLIEKHNGKIEQHRIFETVVPQMEQVDPHFEF